jgi:hypothetical protein
LIVTAGLLLAPGVLRAGDQPIGLRKPTLNVRIYPLEYYPAEELAEVLDDAMGEYLVFIAVAERSNALVVTAPPEYMPEIESAIRAMDVAPKETKTPQMLYRIYMLEPPIEQDMQAFSLTVASSELVSATDARLMAKERGLQIGSIRQSGPENETWENHIQGRAPSKEAIWEFVDYFREAQVRELIWEDEGFMTGVPAAQVTALPARLQTSIRSLLGEKIQTVGYWFGSLSLPGEARAPIGLWSLDLNIETTGTDELKCDIEVHQERPDGQFMVIIGNHIRAKVGKPIIIGYNRDRCGVRTMGALVIVPEEDKTPAGPLSF